MRELPRIENESQEAIIGELIERYEQARMDGLCHEGAWEVALSALDGNGLADDMLKKLELFLHQ